MSTTPRVTNLLDAYAAAADYFARIDATGSWQADATISISFAYPTPYGEVETSVTREMIAQARAHGLLPAAA